MDDRMSGHFLRQRESNIHEYFLDIAAVFLACAVLFPAVSQDAEKLEMVRGWKRLRNYGIVPVGGGSEYGDMGYEKVSILEQPGTRYCVFSCAAVVWHLECMEYIVSVRRIDSFVYGIDSLLF